MDNEFLRLSGDYTLHETDAEHGVAYLFNVNNGGIHRLNRTSFEMLSAFDGHTGTVDIMNSLATIYEVNNAELVDDFSRIIEFCKSIGALVQVENTQKGGDCNEEKI